jgi:hypothetical protein
MRGGVGGYQKYRSFFGSVVLVIVTLLLEGVHQRLILGGKPKLK